MTGGRRREIRLEERRVTFIRPARPLPREYCRFCQTLTEAVTQAQAAALLALAEKEIAALLAAGELHALARGLICLPSLAARL